MPNNKEIVQRINSIVATQKMTQAMKMVAAVKLNQAQQQVLQLRPYTDKLTTLVATLVANLAYHPPQLTHRCLVQRTVQRVLVVVITTDRGLCGPFNTHVLKATERYLQKTTHEQITLMVIGKKATRFFEHTPYPLITTYSTLSAPGTPIGPAATFLVEAFEQGTYDQILLIYNQFKSAAVQVATVTPLLPLILPPIPSPIPYQYEPTPATLLAALVPRLVHTQFYQAVREAQAAEQGARLTAMSQATENAKELLQALRLTYNRVRQTSITNALVEIVAGACIA